MHIGFDVSRAFLKERTGTEEYSFQLVKVLAKIDKENTYTLYARSHQISNLKLPCNFRFKVIAFPRLWTQAGLALECLLNPPDVLFIPAHTLPVIHRLGLKSVVVIHDLGAQFLPQHHQLPQKLYLNKSTEYAVRQASHLIAVSNSTRHDLITKLHCDPQKISVIYEGYDQERFKIPSPAGVSNTKTSEIKKKYGIENNYILFVGTIQPRKNLARLIEAFSFLCQNGIDSSPSAQNDTKLIIVGKKGWLYEEILKAPEKFGVEEKVKFLNYVPREDLPFLYAGALCLALPSLYEGFGLPALEAMACGCPVVASKTSSLPEVVGEAGLLVDPFDVSDIGRNLQMIINDLQLRRTLAKKGLMQAKKFSWEKCGRETLQILEKVVAKN